MGGGGFSTSASDYALDDYVLSLALNFERYIFGGFVFAQSEKDWLPHPSISCPLRELHLRHQLWLNPLHRFVGLRDTKKRTSISLQRLH